MSIKTDFITDCMTGQSVTVQELINMKNTADDGEDISSLIDNIKKDIDKTEDELRKTIDEKIEDISEEIDAKIIILKKQLLVLEEKLKRMNLEVENFKYYDTDKINRNKNNDIIEIIFKNKYRMTIDYINFTYSDEYENYFPSKINYFTDKDELISIEELNTKNNSLSSLNYRMF